MTGVCAQDTAVIACGALARELSVLIKTNHWQHMKVHCLPAKLHNTPVKIAPAVRDKIHALRRRGYRRLFVAYGDCGSGGGLDRVLREEGVERLPGPHCYAFFAGETAFEQLQNAELGTFYLTDFLAQHFDRLILRDMGIEKHPELLSMYFGNYKKVVYLAQTDDAVLRDLAQRAARRLGLDYEYHFTGYGELRAGLAQFAANDKTEGTVTWHA